VIVLCEALEVSTSAFYDWSNAQGKTASNEKDAEVKVTVREVFEESRQTYGKRRIKQSLLKQGQTISLERVSKLMKEENLVPKTVKKFKQTTDSNHQYPVAPNRLNNGFAVDAPNKVWSTDFTYIRTDEGWLYLCIFLDLFSRRVVGWATSNRINAQLAVSALEAAIGRRNPEEGLVAHSDRGSQFCSRAYRAFCASKGIQQSMGKTGSAYDNAITETFFSTLKKELIHGERFKTRKEATAAIFDHIEVFYNRTRMHSSLGYQSPVMYERDVA
jgi:putative transposase